MNKRYKIKPSMPSNTVLIVRYLFELFTTCYPNVSEISPWRKWYHLTPSFQRLHRSNPLGHLHSDLTSGPTWKDSGKCLHFIKFTQVLLFSRTLGYSGVLLYTYNFKFDFFPVSVFMVGWHRYEDLFLICSFEVIKNLSFKQCQE